MVMGDINIDLLKKKTEQTSRDYLNVLQSHGMFYLINSPTGEELIRNSVVKSTLDHIFVRTPKSTNLHTGIVTCKISDHYCVLAAIGLGKTINNLGRETSKYKNIVHPGKYKREMEKLFERSNFSQNNDLDTNYNNFIKMIEETRKRATISVIRKHHSTPGKPWITKTILKLIQERDNLFKKWKNASSKNKDAARIKYTS